MIRSVARQKLDFFLLACATFSEYLLILVKWMWLAKSYLQKHIMNILWQEYYCYCFIADNSHFISYQHLDKLFFSSSSFYEPKIVVPINLHNGQNLSFKSSFHSRNIKQLLTIIVRSCQYHFSPIKSFKNWKKTKLIPHYITSWILRIFCVW